MKKIITKTTFSDLTVIRHYQPVKFVSQPIVLTHPGVNVYITGAKWEVKPPEISKASVSSGTCAALKCKITAGDVCCFSFRMTNGGKSTLSKSLHQQIPNSCIIAQDSYFKVDCSYHCFYTCWKSESLSDHSGCFFFSSGWFCGTSGQQWL